VDKYKVGPLNIKVPETGAAKAVGATGCEVVAQAINAALDECGVPREGRTVKVSTETTIIELPAPWHI